MKKKVLIAVAAILLLAGPSKAWADVEIDQVDCVADPANEACIVVTSDDDITEPIDEPTDASPVIIDEDSELIIDDDTPETWPMYLSFGALSAAVLVFVILNLFGSKKKK